MFYSSLNDEHITQKQSKQAKKVWNVFGGKNVGDYHDLYLKTYVCLLTILDNTTIVMFDFYYNMSRVSARWCSFFFIQMSLHEHEGRSLG